MTCEGASPFRPAAQRRRVAAPACQGKVAATQGVADAAASAAIQGVFSQQAGLDTAEREARLGRSRDPVELPA